MSLPYSRVRPPTVNCAFCDREGVPGVTLISTQALASEFQLHTPRRSHALSFVIYNLAGAVLWEGEIDRARNLLELQEFLSFLEIISSVIPMTEDDVLIDGNSGRPINVNDGLILETDPGSGTAILTYARGCDQSELMKKTRSHRNHVPRSDAPRRLLCIPCRQLYLYPDNE